MSVFVVHRNGRPATTGDLAPLAFAGYAHFTAMQVRGGRIRGLDLHLDRLRAASAELFGRALPDDVVLAHLRAALREGPADVSLTATVYSPEFSTVDASPELLVRTGPATDGPAGPLSLATFEYERVLPEFKHVGEVAKTYYARQAVARGFDDAAFVDRHGRLTEASIWNLAFWDGASVIWPEAPVLAGITMGILRRQLDRLGVPQRSQVLTTADLRELHGAVVMNSWTPGVAVRRIDDVELDTPESFVELLHRAYAEEPLVAP
ncbi:aminotransferase class IV family protein [Amycolatopsis methanolica]|uniref:Branched-chain amino acid aminotransferase/4-amino-4-deoxychorismate lyase n=1 Tax=Amycolatopsis methanolica 239 TaxID=1068978 RepID=A0A076N4M6_AMYME|nr:aminotransferase class IV family protein [Amycolatopsis methanolica]AIJ25755.1 Branched-chain amino acid aminotransferase/4-amino-4-deoxychorismate lyase [Amycolatopsis methanolica 239]